METMEICKRVKNGILSLSDIDKRCKRYVYLVRTSWTNLWERCQIISSLTVFADKYSEYTGGLRMKTEFMDAVQTDLRDASIAPGSKV